MRPPRLLPTALCLLAPLAAPAAPATAAAPRLDAALPGALLRVPLELEPNLGQAPAGVLFAGGGAGHAVSVRDGGATLGFARGEECATLGLSFAGGRRGGRVEGLGLARGRSHYYRGADPSGWLEGVPRYRAVRQRGVYAGVDVVYYGSPAALEYDFVVAPGADASAIEVRLEGARGLRLEGGELLVELPSGLVVWERPRAYEEEGGEEREVAVAYELRGADRFGFALGARDPRRPLRIDPALAFSTFLGGSATEVGQGIATRGDDIYVTGYTASSNFPTTSGLDSTRGGPQDAFVTKYDLSMASPSVEYSTYLGGGGVDTGFAIAVDSMDRAYVTGRTTSADFPHPGGLQPAIGSPGLDDGFTTRLAPTGTIDYSSYLGGSDADSGQGIAALDSGLFFVAGTTKSPDFPNPNAHQPAFAGATDAFVTAVDLSGAPAYAWSTYYGGAAGEGGLAIARDGDGNAYAVGYTASAGFPPMLQGGGLPQSPVRPARRPGAGTPQRLPGSWEDARGRADGEDAGARIGGGSGAYASRTRASGASGPLPSPAGTTYEQLIAMLEGRGEDPLAEALGPAPGAATAEDAAGQDAGPSPQARPENAFLVVFSPAGVVQHEEGFGGTDYDSASAVAVEGAPLLGTGHVHVAGQTLSPDFPLVSPAQPASGGGYDQFVRRWHFDAMLAPVVDFSTYLGGAGTDAAYGIAVVEGSSLVTGYTTSANFPLTEDALDSSLGGGVDATVAAFSPAGRRRFASYLGGAGPDAARAAAPGPGRTLDLTGYTNSNDYLLASPTDSSRASQDAFVTRVQGAAGCPPGEFRVNTFTPNAQNAPSIAKGQDGRFVVTWRSRLQDGAGWGIFAQRFAASAAPVGGEFLVNVSTVGDQIDPEVAVAGSGEFVIVWSGPPASNAFRRRYAADGTPLEGEVQVNSHTALSVQTTARVARTPSGEFVVVWRSGGQDGDSYGIFGQRYDAAGNPAGGEFLVNTVTAGNQIDPAVAIDPSGAFVVVWSDQGGRDGDQGAIFAQRFDAAGVKQGGEILVNSITQGSQRFPTLARDATGDFVVTWYGPVTAPTDLDVALQRFDAAGVKLGPELLVNEFTTGSQSDPTVAVAPEGNFVVTWKSGGGNDGSSYGVFARRYDAAGNPDGGEFLVNAATVGNQSMPDVAVDGDGLFAIAWSSDPSGSNADVIVRDCP